MIQPCFEGVHIPIFIASVLVLAAAAGFIVLLLALVIRARGRAPSAARLQKQAEEAAAAAMTDSEAVQEKLRAAIGEYIISSTLEEYRPAGYFFGLLEMFLVYLVCFFANYHEVLTMVV